MLIWTFSRFILDLAEKSSVHTKEHRIRQRYYDFEIGNIALLNFKYLNIGKYVPFQCFFFCCCCCCRISKSRDIAVCPRFPIEELSRNFRTRAQTSFIKWSLTAIWNQNTFISCISFFNTPSFIDGRMQDLFSPFFCHSLSCCITFIRYNMHIVLCVCVILHCAACNAQSFQLVLTKIYISLIQRAVIQINIWLNMNNLIKAEYMAVFFITSSTSLLA